MPSAIVDEAGTETLYAEDAALFLDVDGTLLEMTSRPGAVLSVFRHRCAAFSSRIAAAPLSTPGGQFDLGRLRENVAFERELCNKWMVMPDVLRFNSHITS